MLSEQWGAWKVQGRNNLELWFSMGGGGDSFASQGRLDSDWRHFGLSCGGRGQAATAPGVEVRDAAGRPPVHRTAPHSRELLSTVLRLRTSALDC